MAELLKREPVPISPMLENHHKMVKIRALSAAIVRAKEQEPGMNQALLIQRLEDQRKALKATLPPLRLVT